MGNQLRTAGELLGADPAGITFRSSRERIAWLAGLRERVDRSERSAAGSFASASMTSAGARRDVAALIRV